MNEREARGMREYLEDCQRRPIYHDGTPRKKWHELGDLERETWIKGNFGPSYELTPEGEQAVIPGCEKNLAPGKRQLDLF